MKIGIFTHYYLSENYGGNFQAYALCKVLNDMGHTAEQICYDRKLLLSPKKSILRRTIKKAYNLGIRVVFWKHYHNLSKRKSAILQFNKDFIPHSTNVYDDKSLFQLNPLYDCFITGSDQVWNPCVLCNGFLLEFCDEAKVRISYAASIAASKLDYEIEERLKQALHHFNSISVREKDSVCLLNKMGIEDVSWVLDPTLLVSAQEWRLISKEYKIEEKYVFAYFLGENKHSRENALRYAHEHGLRLITLPHLTGRIRNCDLHYGDLQLYDVSPNQLIYLIDHAECIFTDSFHISVFSIILNKNFYVYKRNSIDTMTNRITSLLELFNMPERFLVEDEAYDRLNDCNDYIDTNKYYALKQQSLEFLAAALGGVNHQESN